MDVLGDGVLKFIACRVTIDGDISEDSPMEVVLYHCIDSSFGCVPQIWSMRKRRKKARQTSCSHDRRLFFESGAGDHSDRMIAGILKIWNPVQVVREII